MKKYFYMLLVLDYTIRLIYEYGRGVHGFVRKIISQRVGLRTSCVTTHIELIHLSTYQVLYFERSGAGQKKNFLTLKIKTSTGLFELGQTSMSSSRPYCMVIMGWYFSKELSGQKGDGSFMCFIIIRSKYTHYFLGHY